MSVLEKKKEKTKKSVDSDKKVSDTGVYNKHEIDYTFLFFIVLLTCAGLVMLLSASTPTANSKFDNSYYFFLRQLAYVVVGFGGMFVISNINYNLYKKFAVPMMGVCLLLLILVAIPGIGKLYNGSRRWLELGPVQIQPSEFMKPVVAMYFAYLLEREKHGLDTWGKSAKYIIILAILLVLMMLEPHLSGAIVICGIGAVVMVIAGFRIKPVVLAGLVVAPVGCVILYFFDKVRWARISSFIDPFHDLQGKSYQIAQSLYSIGSGGIFGKGLGQSMQKYSFLPEPYNDFIFAVVCEELGLIGAAAIIILFALFIFRGIKIAMEAPDFFSTIVVSGIVAQVSIQTILNIAVATSSVPCTGVSLPFFSYGGTAICILLFEMGIVLNISKFTNRRGNVFSHFDKKNKE